MPATLCIPSHSSGYQSQSTIVSGDYPESPFIDGRAILYIIGRDDFFETNSNKKYTAVLVRQVSEKEANTKYTDILDSCMRVFTMHGKIRHIWNDYRIYNGEVIVLDSPETKSQTFLNVESVSNADEAMMEEIKQEALEAKTSRLSPDFINYLKMPEEDRKAYCKARQKPSPRSCACTIL